MFKPVTGQYVSSSCNSLYERIANIRRNMILGIRHIRNGHLRFMRQIINVFAKCCIFKS